MSTNPLKPMNKPSEDAISYIFIGSFVALLVMVGLTKSFLALLGCVAALFGAVYILARK